jgi:hypothetical protein
LNWVSGGAKPDSATEPCADLDEVDVLQQGVVLVVVRRGALDAAAARRDAADRPHLDGVVLQLHLLLVAGEEPLEDRRVDPCPGRKPPFSGVKRPVLSYKNAIETRCLLWETLSALKRPEALKRPGAGPDSA